MASLILNPSSSPVFIHATPIHSRAIQYFDHDVQARVVYVPSTELRYRSRLGARQRRQADVPEPRQARRDLPDVKNEDRISDLSQSKRHEGLPTEIRSPSCSGAPAERSGRGGGAYHELTRDYEFMNVLTNVQIMGWRSTRSWGAPLVQTCGWETRKISDEDRYSSRESEIQYIVRVRKTRAESVVLVAATDRKCCKKR